MSMKAVRPLANMGATAFLKTSIGAVREELRNPTDRTGEHLENRAHMVAGALMLPALISWIFGSSDKS